MRPPHQVHVSGALRALLSPTPPSRIQTGPLVPSQPAAGLRYSGPNQWAPAASSPASQPWSAWESLRMTKSEPAKFPNPYPPCQLKHTGPLPFAWYPSPCEQQLWHGGHPPHCWSYWLEPHLLGSPGGWMAEPGSGGPTKPGSRRTRDGGPRLYLSPSPGPKPRMLVKRSCIPSCPYGSPQELSPAR